ncbi:MAG: hypothetical protein ACYDGW_08245 [Vulcanimicrobiaceae bacterium]
MMKHLGILSLLAALAFSTSGAHAASAPINPCAVVTSADASMALGVPAPPGFAASHIVNAELGGGHPVGPKVLCRYLTSVGDVNAHIQSYASARSKFDADRKAWWPTKAYTGIGDAAFYAGGGNMEVLKGHYILWLSLTFKKQIAPRYADPRLIALAKKAVTRL